MRNEKLLLGPTKLQESGSRLFSSDSVPLGLPSESFSNRLELNISETSEFQENFLERNKESHGPGQLNLNMFNAQAETHGGFSAHDERFKPRPGALLIALGAILIVILAFVSFAVISQILFGAYGIEDIGHLLISSDKVQNAGVLGYVAGLIFVLGTIIIQLRRFFRRGARFDPSDW
jgi:hypothetical protein